MTNQEEDADVAIKVIDYLHLVHRALIECGNEEDAAHAWAMINLLSDNDPLPLKELGNATTYP